jgi:hypothetical protein
MKKSGLADSPFFTTPQAQNTAPAPSLLEPEKPADESNTNILPYPQSTEKNVTTPSQVPAEENQDQKRSSERTFERSIERSNERSTQRPVKRKREKIRHTFDIYRDQLVALQMIQLEKFQAGKKKPKLGKMVAEGIDLFIKQEASKKK